MSMSPLSITVPPSVHRQQEQSHAHTDERLTASPAGRFAWGTGLAGLAVLGLGVALAHTWHDGLRRFAFAYLANFAFVLSLSLGALVFLLIQHVTRAGWSVTVRRLCEILAANVSTCAILFLPILAAVLFGRGLLYPWTSPTYLATHESVVHPAFYPNLYFFLIRMAICFAAWIALATFYHRRSLQQDQTGDPSLSRAMQRLSAPGLVILGFTITFAAFDLLMSLDPSWISTIFGIYYFSGGMVGFLAVLILSTATVQRRGFLTRSVHREHYHDLGKLLFAFLFFWGYIAFSQYVLIWYGNIPEETVWFLRRGASTDPAQTNPWTAVSLLLLFGHLLIPFASLLSRFGKRRVWILCAWATWLLLTHWLDMLWLVGPECYPEHPALGLNASAVLLNVICLLGLGLLYTSGAARLAASRSLRPLRDPRLEESLAFENI